MTLYHASVVLYADGDVVDALTFEKTKYVVQVEQGPNGWVDDFLEENRPVRYPSRRKTSFAFDKPGFCADFMNSRGINDYSIYEVEMVNPRACPMYMIQVIERSNRPPNTALAVEYWNPTAKWNRLEYLSTSMKILRKVVLPHMNLIRGANYLIGVDRDLAIQLFNKV